jgi:hypothetical protein
MANGSSVLQNVPAVITVVNSVMKIGCAVMTNDSSVIKNVSRTKIGLH